jgi:hypothetical protein
MFKGFKLEDIDFGENLSYFKNLGLGLYENYNSQIKKSLNSFLLNDNSLDGSKIINSWFPQINAHIFISHSHKDESKVIALSGWLFKTFGIKSFIDSCIWGYGNELIQILDNEYSWMDEVNKIYYYNKVLDSASHVHMMLSTTLNAMIDKTECLIFYDTPNSIEPFETIDKTCSPWIYSEIAFSQIVKIRLPSRLSKVIKEERYLSADGADHFEKALKVKYDVDSSHLKEIDISTLIEWSKYSQLSNAEDALDKLYELTFPITKLHG